jgi:hypothetical protein
MRTAAIGCNAVLFAITGMIVLTEGVPSRARYMVLTLLMLFVPLLSAVVLARQHVAPQGPHANDDARPGGTAVHWATVLGNLVLLGASCWAAVAQYPYAEGSGMIPLALLVVGTPILSLAALRGGGRSGVQKEPRIAPNG